jgi:Fe-S cluster biosynthesis and repair protein YggX
MEDNDDTNQSQVPTFRFNFSTEFTKELGYFAKLYKYEDRTEFKEKWKEWIEDNTEIINEEKKRLRNLGYKKDIENKMYKSVRYYFVKKKDKETTKRRKRTVISKKIIQQIIQHIKNNNFGEDFTPQLAYEDFYKTNIDLIMNEHNEHNEHNELNININNKFLENKIKKTYKNKFYVLVRNKIKN